MNLKQFVQYCSGETVDIDTTSSVFCFRSTISHPVLFFSWLFSHTTIPLRSVDVERESIASIERLLQTSCLGESLWYYLGDIQSLDEKKRSWIWSYLSRYTGPHTILVSLCEKNIAKKSSKNIAVIDLPDMIRANDVEKLVYMVPKRHHKIILSAMQTIYKQSATRIPFESFFLIVHYCIVSGRQRSKFIDNYLDTIVVPDMSLFTLSQHFFARNSKHFFAYWMHCKRVYASQFWTTFWSDQLWRAACYVRYMEQKRVVEAKKIAFRLPFSFINYDWRKYKAHNLIRAHQSVYDIDYHIKNGGNMLTLELFYSKFLMSSL